MPKPTTTDLAARIAAALEPLHKQHADLMSPHEYRSRIIDLQSLIRDLAPPREPTPALVAIRHQSCPVCYGVGTVRADTYGAAGAIDERDATCPRCSGKKTVSIERTLEPAEVFKELLAQTERADKAESRLAQLEAQARGRSRPQSL